MLALGAAAALHLLLHRWHLERTAALFVGLPTVLATTLALTPRARSATGMAVKGTAAALLLAGFVLGERLVGLLLAGPLFLLVAVVIGVTLDMVRERRGRTCALVAVPLLLAAASTEGVHPATSRPREEEVAVTRTVAAGAGAVERALATPPRLGRPLPAFLRLGFPRPVTAIGSGLAPGDRRTLLFASRERYGRHRQSALVLEVAGSRPGAVAFRAVRDDTPVADWLTWEGAEVTWAEVEPGRTEVRWSLRYHRELDPAWYFGPLERYAVRLAAGYLLDAVATPPRTPLSRAGTVLVHDHEPSPRTT